MVTASFHPQIGGVETHVRKVVERLGDHGVSVTVLTHHRDLTTPVTETIGGVLVRRFPLTICAPRYQCSAALWRYLATHPNDYDLVHVHSYHTLSSLGTAIASGRPLIFTPHYLGTPKGALRTVLHLAYRPAGTYLIGRSTAVICVSETERKLLLRHFPGAESKVALIPNGVDPALYTAATARAVRPQAPRIVTAGRLVADKRVDQVIAASASLQTPVELVVVGDGPAFPELRKQVKHLGIDDRVTFTGQLEHERIAELLVTADVVTSAGSLECFGLTLAEGIAAGATVVASNIPAHHEVAMLAGIESRVILVDTANTSRYAEALNTALTIGRHPVGSTTLPQWDDVAAETARVYRTIYGFRARPSK